jgi:maltose alpha-D-glucosyltransferase/alpha-amylase
MSASSLWYKDAIIYQAHVKAFADSNGDGIGDFGGLVGKLDYLQSLGVTALWVLPFYPSPLRDDGYDIADYYDVNPQYGTLADFRAFLKEAHRRGLRVITELVINHTSDQHQWFQRARRAKPGSVERDYYVWSDTTEKYQDARIIFKDFEPSNWSWDPVAGAYYWHRFFHHQPDLNFDNPAVHKAVFRIFDFWLGMGVDGLRLDAIPYLYEREGTNCENLPETHAYLRDLRTEVERKYPDAMLLAEANQWPEDSVAYFGKGDSCHMAFHFPVMPRMFMALQMEDRYPIIDILEQTPAIPENCQWAIFLRNHDELTLEMVTDEERDYMYRMYATDQRARINLGIRRRLAPLLGNNRRKIELINILLFSLPGTPIIYYGDEIGMGDNIYLGDRNGVRTPMQWSADRNAGFSRANPQQLYFPIIIDPEYHYESVNVENQERNLSSLLNWMRRVTAMRRKYLAFGRGSMEFLNSNNSKVLTFLRRHGDEIILVVVNLSRFSQAVELDLHEFANRTPREIFSRNKFPNVKADGIYSLTVGPHGHYWLLIEPAPAAETQAASLERILPKLKGVAKTADLLSENARAQLQTSILPAYLPICRWFRSKARTIQRVEVRRALLVDENPDSARLLWVDVHFSEGLPETYLLPAVCAESEAAERRRAQAPKSCIASLDNGGALFDASGDENFQRALFALIAGRDRLRDDSRGELTGIPARDMRRALGEANTASLTCRALGVEQSNTAIVYGNQYFLKLYRKVEDGESPDIELTRFLTEKANFPCVSPFAGLIEFRPAEGQPPQVLAMLQSLVTNAEDVWTLTIDAATRYFERVLAARVSMAETGVTLPPIAPSLLENDFLKTPLAVQEIIGAIYPTRAELLGQRTGEMHLALSGPEAAGDPAFAPEPFSMLYQRSLLQSMSGLTRKTFASLKRHLSSLPETLRADAARLLEAQKDIVALQDRVLRGRIGAMKTRIHGDYHLGQVLFTGKDFIIIDFEGEPARSLGERKLKRSPLADVAGMLRSFHYAISSALLRHVAASPEDATALQPWADLWYACVAGSFLRSYLKTIGDAKFVPTDPAAFERLLQAFVLEKAVYELGYELNNRPDWVAIPMRGIAQVLSQTQNSTAG